MKGLTDALACFGLALVGDRRADLLGRWSILCIELMLDFFRASFFTFGDLLGLKEDKKSRFILVLGRNLCIRTILLFIFIITEDSRLNNEILPAIYEKITGIAEID